MTTLPKKLAFIDLETTGTSPARDRVIEVGIVRVENGKRVHKFQSLVNPQGFLPPEITRMTGISSAELENAPTFRQIKDDILAATEGCMLVAHSVRFDYGFLKNEFRREGMTFRIPHFCTVKLFRALYPRLTHHNLDRLIEKFDLECSNRHRAYGDALVLWEFYQKVLTTFSEKKILSIINRITGKPTLPLKLKLETVDSLPESPGVYIFYGPDRIPLYVGKSVNIRDRVLSHFSADYERGTEMKMAQQIEGVEAVPTAGELGAFLKESELIKKLQPVYNRVGRQARKIITMGRMSGKDGYHSVALVERDRIDPGEIDKIISAFKSRKQAKEFLAQVAKEKGLCAKLLGVESTNQSCFGYRLGQCRGACVGKEKPEIYNARFALAFSGHQFKSWPFNGAVLIEENDEIGGRKEFHLVDKWCYLGTVGYREDLPDGELGGDVQFDVDVYKILQRFLSKRENWKRIKQFPKDSFFRSSVDGVGVLENLR